MERKIEDVLAETSVIRATIDDVRSTIIDQAKPTPAISDPAQLSAAFADIARSMSSLREVLDLADAIASQAVLLAANTTPNPAQPPQRIPGIIDQVDTMLAHIRSLETSIATPPPEPLKPAD